MAATAYVARRIGEKDREGASIGAAETLLTAVAILMFRRGKWKQQQI